MAPGDVLMRFIECPMSYCTDVYMFYYTIWYIGMLFCPHYHDVTWAVSHLKSPVTPHLFNSLVIQTRQNIKVPYCWPFVRAINQLCGNRIHVITPWYYGYLKLSCPWWHLWRVLVNKIANCQFRDIANLINIMISHWRKGWPWKGKWLFLVETAY